MHSLHDFLRQSLWLSVLIVPVPAGMFAVQTAHMLLVSLLTLTVLGTAVPFLYFSAQKRGWGAEDGKRRCAVHLECALSVFALLWLGLWSAAAEGAALETGLGPALSAAAGGTAMLLVMLVIFSLDRGVLALYRRLFSLGEARRQWLALSFLAGWIPGVILCAVFALALANAGSPFLFLLVMSGGMTWALYLKVFLGLMGIVFYLYFSAGGQRLRRVIQVVFTGALWLLALYAPLVLSVQIPGAGAWRVWADPAYLSIFPFLSDLWTVGLAYWAGRKITAWIYAAAE